MRYPKISVMVLAICFLPSLLFAASVTNEGKSAVKLSGKTKSGILVAMTVSPGQTLPLRQPVLWVEHVVEGTKQDINIRIVENNGNSGRIQTPGGRYTFSNQAGSPSYSQVSPVKSSAPLQAGYAINSSNVEIMITLIGHTGRTLKHRIMPGQTITIPEDTVEVKVGSLNSNRGNEEVQLLIVMPDGKQHVVRSSKTSIRL